MEERPSDETEEDDRGSDETDDGIDLARLLERGGVVRCRRGVDLRPVVGGNVRVTLRVGNACARATMALRTSRKGLVFP